MIFFTPGLFFANLSVDGVFVEQETRGRWMSVVLQAAGYSYPGNLTVYMQNVQCVHCGQVQLLALEALSSALHVNTSVHSVFLENAFIAPFLVEGVSGTVDIHNISCRQCTMTAASASLFSFAVFTKDEQRQLNAYLSDITFDQLYVGKSSAGLVKAEGQIRLIIGPRPVHFLVIGTIHLCHHGS